MCVHLTEAVLHSGLRRDLRALAFTLAHRADRRTWESFPGVARMAADVAAGERTVQYQLRELTALGIIAPTANSKGGRRRTVCYRFDPTALPPSFHRVRREMSKQKLAQGVLAARAGLSPTRISHLLRCVVHPSPAEYSALHEVIAAGSETPLALGHLFPPAFRQTPQAPSAPFAVLAEIEDGCNSEEKECNQRAETPQSLCAPDLSERTERKEDHAPVGAARAVGALWKPLARPGKNRRACLKLMWELGKIIPTIDSGDLWQEFKRQATDAGLVWEIYDNLRERVDTVRARLAIRELVAQGLDGRELAAHAADLLRQRRASSHPDVVARWIRAEQARMRRSRCGTLEGQLERTA